MNPGTGSSPGNREPCRGGARPTFMRSSPPLVAAIGVAVLLTGCGGSPHRAAVQPAGVSARSTTVATPSPTASGSDCPPVKHTSGYVTIDYLDFIRYRGRDYVSGLDPQSRPIPTTQTGGVVLHVRCSLSQLNDRTGKEPAERRDGDAAFLPAGTPVYAVRGWSTNCRLAARRDNRLYLYLAYRNGGQHAAPVACAVRK